MGSSKQHTSSSSEPWAPTIPLLQNFLDGIGGLASGGFGPTDFQQKAIDSLLQKSANLPDFSPQATDITKGFLTGDPNGMLGKAYGAYQNAMSPIANASLDPTQTPGLANALSTIRSDIGNDVNGMFAGAGRDMSGMHVQALGRGIAQGEAPTLFNQYNQNVAARQGAANGLLGAAGATSTAMGSNKAMGLNMMAGLPGLINSVPMAQLQAASTAKGVPMQNIAQLLALTLPIASLGGQSESTSKYTPSFGAQLGQGMQIAGTGLGLGGSMMGMPMMSGGFNPFGGFTGNYFPGNPAAAGAGYGQYGGQYYPYFR